MSEQTPPHSSFIKAYAVNLFLQFEWLLLAVLLLVLYFWKDIPISLFWAALGFWLLLPLVVTWFVVWATGCDTSPGPSANYVSRCLHAVGCADVPPER